MLYQTTEHRYHTHTHTSTHVQAKRFVVSRSRESCSNSTSESISVYANRVNWINYMYSPWSNRERTTEQQAKWRKKAYTASEWTKIVYRKAICVRCMSVWLDCAQCEQFFRYCCCRRCFPKYISVIRSFAAERAIERNEFLLLYGWLNCSHLLLVSLTLWPPPSIRIIIFYATALLIIAIVNDIGILIEHQSR